MNKEFDLLVFIGRFQPLHNAQVAVIRQALEKAHHVLVVIGSANQPRSTRNPFTAGERQGMIETHFAEAQSTNYIPPTLHTALIDDVYSDKEWAINVQRAVSRLMGQQDRKVGLIGGSALEAENYYPKLFPQWEPVTVTGHSGVRGTDIREFLFDDDVEEFQTMIPLHVPADIFEGLRAFRFTETYLDILEEESNLSPSARSAPVRSVCAVVLQAGYVLLHKRDGIPGKGKFELPNVTDHDGNATETAARLFAHIVKETALGVDEDTMRASAKASFEITMNPFRDPTMPSIAVGLVCDLPLATKLPSTLPQWAWYDLSKLDTSKLFLDHHLIIQTALKLRQEQGVEFVVKPAK